MDYWPQHPPSMGAEKEAAVAMIIRESADPRLCFIERATVDGDPWSGQIAFPGGKREVIDDDLLMTSRRETLEETAWDLSLHKPLCRLRDVVRPIGEDYVLRIACFVFIVADLAPPTPNYEVSRCIEVPYSYLIDSTNQNLKWWSQTQRSYPAIELPDGALLWGITLGFVNELLGLLQTD